eukprot:4434096-Amphidinium_carterae.1
MSASGAFSTASRTISLSPRKSYGNPQDSTAACKVREHTSDHSYHSEQKKNKKFQGLVSH